MFGMYRSILIIIFILFNLNISASTLQMGIMQDKFNAASKYEHLIEYFAGKKIKISPVVFYNYVNAAKMFSEGNIDFMFSGSGVAATMILKEIAYPLVRPVYTNGWSTYWAVVVANKSFKSSGNLAKDLKEKKIGATSLASSGEFFGRSILGDQMKMLKMASHSAGLKYLNLGMVDLAIVKNRVWDEKKKKYPNLVVIGEDKRQNPNDTLIVSVKTNKSLVKKVKQIFLNIGKDNSKGAKKLKSNMKISHYIPTTPKDFESTLALIKKAGVKKDFNYSFDD